MTQLRLVPSQDIREVDLVALAELLHGVTPRLLPDFLGLAAEFGVVVQIVEAKAPAFLVNTWTGTPGSGC